MTEWRLLDSGPHDAAYNMALDEAIALACREGRVPPTFRLYTWISRSLTLGYFQKFSEEFDHKRLQEEGVAVVRRITGGRAVPHEKDIAYSVVCPIDTPLFPRNLVGTFMWIARGLVAGLNRMGLPAELSPEKGNGTGTGHTPLCFISLSRWEITVRGQKIGGSAQKRWTDLFLQQGSLLLEGDTRWIVPYLKLPSEEMRERVRQEMSKKITSCVRILGRPLPMERVKREIASAMEETLGITLKPERLTSWEEEMAAHLACEKYSHFLWNTRRTQIT